MATKIAINSFVRIVQLVLGDEIKSKGPEYLTKNDLIVTKTHAHLLKDVSTTMTISSTLEKEATKSCFDAGAKKVIITAPPKGETPVKLVLVEKNKSFCCTRNSIHFTNVPYLANNLLLTINTLQENYSITPSILTVEQPYNIVSPKYLDKNRFNIWNITSFKINTFWRYRWNTSNPSIMNEYRTNSTIIDRKSTYSYSRDTKKISSIFTYIIEVQFPNIYIFVCYETTTGLEYAKHLKTSLEKMGAHCFVAETDLLPHQISAEVIETKIKTCNYFVLIITFCALKSKEVHKEVELAKKYGKKIIICRNDYVPRELVGSYFPDVFHFQHIDFSSKEELAQKVLVNLLKMNLSYG